MLVIGLLCLAVCVAFPNLRSDCISTLYNGIRPNDAQYMTANLIYNKRLNNTPFAIYEPHTIEDLSGILCRLRKDGIRPVVRGGGHSYIGLSTCDDGTCAVIRMENFKSIIVDPVSSTVEVSAGVNVQEFLDALHIYGVATVTGLCGPVGIIGSTLGGGFGVLSHLHGLASDNMVGATVVLGNGTVLRANATTNSNLLWALRGGGQGNLGVVTSIALRTYSVPTSLYTYQYHLFIVKPGMLVDALMEWQRFAQISDPRLIFTRLVMGYSGNQSKHQIIVIFNGTVTDAYAMIIESSMLDFVDPVMCSDPNTVERSVCENLTWDKLCALMQRCGYEAWVAFSAHSRFSERLLSREEAVSLSNTFETIHSSSCQPTWASVDIDRFNGAISRMPSSESAFVHRDKVFMYQFYVKWDASVTPAPNPECMQWVYDVYTTAGNFMSNRSFPNYRDSTLENWQDSYYGGNYARMQQIKQAYDPQNIMDSFQGIDLP